MSVPIEFTYAKLKISGPSSKVFKIINCVPYFKFKQSCQTTDAIAIEDGTTIVFLKDNYYNLTITAYPDGCPFANLPIELEKVFVDPSVSLTVVQAPNTITITGVIPVGTKFRFFTNGNLLRYFKCLEVITTLGISNVSDKTDEITADDIATKIRYIPAIPTALSLLPPIPYPTDNPLLPPQYPATVPDTTFPWRESIIPWKQEQVFPSGGGVIITPDAPFGLTPFPPFPAPPFPVNATNGYIDQYDKLRSVPNSVIYYIGFDQRLILPKTEAWTLFLTNFIDRGTSGNPADPMWLLVNYQKKVYMNALSLDKLQFYLEKIESFVNNAFSAVSTYGKPLTSSFSENLVLFFLDMHIGGGGDCYPDFVIKWFSDFVKFVGIGNPTNPERKQLLMYGNTTSPRIFDYFREKNCEVIAKADESTIAYWWHLAGLSSDALVFECVHNIVAFSQFTNVIYMTVYSKLHPVNPISALLPNYPDFMANYVAAATSNDKLNVVREAYRILVPNSLSFSLVQPKVPDPSGNVIKSRHLHQAIMVSNQAVPPANQAFVYFSYNPGQYNANFSANLDGLELLTPNLDILATSVPSPLDQETIVDPSRPLIPIFPKPTYAPFGLGYRRCAGEMLSYLITEKLYAKFATINFVEASGVYPLVSIAPFKQVPDNIFAVQLTL